MSDYDAVVIGSGINGLTCSAILAKAGWKVLVIEKAEMPGGAAKSSELTKEGFIHDWYSTNLGSFLGGPFYREFKNELESNGFTPVISDKPFASVFPDETGVKVYQDNEKTNDQFKKLSLNDFQAWEQLKEFFDGFSPDLLPLMEMELPSLKAATQLLKLYRKLKFKKAVELASFIAQSPREFVESTFENEKTRALFTPWAFHLDYAPDIANGAIFPLIEVISNQRNGMGVAKGGISNMIDSIIKVIKAHNGEVMLNKTVEKIILKEGRAVGVRLEGGEEILAKKAVIGNVTPTQLIERLLDKEVLPSHYVQKAENFRYGPGSMMIHLALSNKLEWLAGDEYSSFAYIHIGPYTNDIARTYTSIQAGMIPDKPMLIIGQQSAVDTTRAPQGKQTLWIQVRALPSEVKGDERNKIKPALWDEMKEKLADRIINEIAIYAPNIKDLILQRVVFSPMDLQNDNPNLVGGDNVGGSHHTFQYYLFRPIPGYSRYETPIKQLFVCGSTTWPGGGLGGTSGYLLGNKLLQ